jgi:uncharacterized protein YbjT (DUF2867 family)
MKPNTEHSFVTDTVFHRYNLPVEGKWFCHDFNQMLNLRIGASSRVKTKKVLITGATGNVGMEVIRALSRQQHGVEIVGAVRDTEADGCKFSETKIKLRKLDFLDEHTFEDALDDISVLFLIRPTQILDAAAVFDPFIRKAREMGVKHIVFLSVQGAQQTSIVPHKRIEQSIVQSGVAFTFLRPAYFMQNFTTVLREELIQSKGFSLPAGDTPFALVDVRDIASVAAKVLLSPTMHQGMAYELTSNELLTFKQMAFKISEAVGEQIRFRSPVLWEFYWMKHLAGIPFAKIMLMIWLHFLPRFQKSPDLTDCVERITGRQPISFEQFAKDYRMCMV